MPRRGSAATPALAALVAAGVQHTVHAYDHDPRTAATDGGYALEAARALGVPPERVLKTLLADVDGELVVAVLPATTRLDLKSLAAAVGGKHAALAEPGVAQRATGYVVGGISPFGQRRRLRTVLDAAAAGHRTVLVSAGRRGLDVEVPVGALAELLDAVVAPVARPG